MDKRNGFVFILGMHRSGTSCLAGCLEACGLYLGNVRRTGRFNAKGYFEIKKLQLLHDQILAMNRGAWHAPPEKVVVHPYHQKALNTIIRELSEHGPCGIKDPRQLLLLEEWMTLVNHPSPVGTFRHPKAVAQSLLRRNKMPMEKGYALWLHYNRALVRHHRLSPFPIVEFDLSDIETYCLQVGEVALKLGLSPEMKKLQEFVSPELEHHVSEGPVPAICRDLYTYLNHHRIRIRDLQPHGDHGHTLKNRKGMAWYVNLLTRAGLSLKP